MTKPPAARDGDRVQVHYTGTLKHGEVFDSSRAQAPLSFVVGSGAQLKGSKLMLEGFDRVVRGLRVGESRVIRLEPADAFGEHDRSLVVRVPSAAAGARLRVGDVVRFDDRDAVVTAVTDADVTIDANHPLAGQALTFDVELVAIDQAVSTRAP